MNKRKELRQFRVIIAEIMLGIFKSAHRNNWQCIVITVRLSVEVPMLGIINTCEGISEIISEKSS